MSKSTRFVIGTSEGLLGLLMEGFRGFAILCARVVVAVVVVVVVGFWDVGICWTLSDYLI